VKTLPQPLSGNDIPTDETRTDVNLLKLFTTTMGSFGDATTFYATGVALLAIVIAFVLFLPTGFVKWLQKKNYQYEVTSALYMLTPTEKFIFSMCHSTESNTTVSD
jgi:hypothetical protein